MRWHAAYIMKTKSVIFALSISLLMLGGCVAAGPGYGPDYGYYPPAPRPYYGYARPYYVNPRPVIVVPRGGYNRPHYEGNHYGGGRGYGGGYGGGHGRRGRD